MTPKEVRQLCAQANAPLPEGMHAGNFEKIKNTRRKVVDGREFRSTLEANTYQLLKSWEDAGEIYDLELQPKYILQAKQKGIRAITYTADFRYRWVNPERHGYKETVVIDAKGWKTDVYRLKAKLFRVSYPQISFREWTKETLKANGG